LKSDRWKKHETYKGSRKSIFLLGGIDDLKGQLD
jgi:hypothetical protein